MHLAVLTGGGDVPGLNPAIQSIVNEASIRGWQVTGFRRGWAGPLNFDPDDIHGSKDWIVPLSAETVWGIDRTGGTILKTSRTKPSQTKKRDLPEFLKVNFLNHSDDDFVDATTHVLTVFAVLNIDVLIAIGGDDTLSNAAHLHQKGLKTICIPKTMDNDVFGTDYCIGFSTCVTRSVELINRLRTPVGSHERFLVVELFGRNCGYSALYAGYLAGADRTLISEVPIDMEKLAKLLVQDRTKNKSNYAIVIVSEGASLIDQEVLESGEADAYGHHKLGGIGQLVGSELKRLTGMNVMNQNLAYLLRAGAPDAVDLMVAKNFGSMAVRLIEEGRTGLMTVIKEGKYSTESASIHITGERRVEVNAMYDEENYRPSIKQLDGMPMLLR